MIKKIELTVHALTSVSYYLIILFWVDREAYRIDRPCVYVTQNSLGSLNYL